MSKVFLIKAKTEDELTEKYNKETKDFFAAVPIQKNDGTWIYFCYTDKNKPATAKPANGQEDEPATPSQLSYLEKLGFNGNYDNLSKKEASKKIEELLEKKPQNY